MLADEIRALLRSEAHADGLTTTRIARLLGRDRSSVLDALRSSAMPDVYIDRWHGSKAVWISVAPPKDCPRPRSSS